MTAAKPACMYTTQWSPVFAPLRTHAKFLFCFSELAKLEAATKQLLAAWKLGLEHDCTQGSISPRLKSGADVARNRAVATQAKWGAHKREGGLYWSTYKVLLCTKLTAQLTIRGSHVLEEQLPQAS